MSREQNLEQFESFLKECTHPPKSAKNYPDHKRIDECIRLVNESDGYPEVAMTDYNDSSRFADLKSRIEKLPEYNDYNEKGNRQYSNAMEWYLRFLKARELFGYHTGNTTSPLPHRSRQIIFFGTPGSGKSHRVKALTEGKKVHRTTFHPDSDYASFVGCYKPTMKKSFDPILSFETLKELAEDFYGTYPIARFTAQYYKSLEVLDTKQQAEIRKIIIAQNNGGKETSGDQEPYMRQPMAGVKYLESLGLLKGSNGEISYSFISQVFTEAYVDAWKHPEEEVYLVIEEINRGNCAQIFGDLFQLLDRNSEGKSEYRIKADSDLRDYLYRQLGEEHEGIKNGELCLPPNLHILATMNTSDQSLFPMDSAFKRRWDWEYVPVDYSEAVPSSHFVIALGDKEYRWVDFLKEVNERIRTATDSEDKQMGNFFIKSDISEAEFKSKVMFYLWNEVCRDEYGTPNNFFRSKQNNEEVEFSFNDLYQADGLDKLHGFMAYLGVSSPSTVENTDEDIEATEQV